MKKENWYKFQEWIAQELKELDPYTRCTKGSGNGGEKGDVKNNVGLNIECKCYKTKSPYNQEWLDKVNTEIPLHSDKIGIVITENKNKVKVVHLSWDDFWEMYKDAYSYKNPSANGF